MFALTPAERRGALVFVLLLALGTGWDLWCARHPRTDPPATSAPPPAPAASTPDEPAPADSGRIAADPGSPPVFRVDLNRASVGELDALPGVGPVLAARIVAHRSAHGPFLQVEELRAVRGIGPRLMERLRERVTVGLTRP